MPNLDNYISVRTALCVRIQIDQYRTTLNGVFLPEVLLFTDYGSNINILGETYLAVGALTSISPTTSELVSSSDNITVSLSGIPNTSIAEINYSRIKGSPVKVYRVFFDVQTGVQIGAAQGKFIGFINNYSLSEDHDIIERTSSNTISLICASNVDILSRKTAGRKTNPQSQKRFFPNDVALDRVPKLKYTAFNFGRDT
jgi:hypothetical protein